MDQELAIKVENLSKTFRLPHEKVNSVKSRFIQPFKRSRYESQKALQDVSFSVNQGEFFGIIGRNGSGKSTLLKLLAGIYVPTDGSIAINGLLTPFIELGVGFNPELTARDNVYLNGALLGFNRREMAAMYNDIVNFAELKRFMDQKLKNFSSGMQVRLAFSIAVRARSDILLIDEVLAVGDASFRRKCYDYFYQAKRAGRTIIFVSHDMDEVRNFCDRGILINDGQIVAGGTSAEIADRYLKLNLGSIETEINDINRGAKSGKSNSEAKITDIWTAKAGKKTAVFGPSQKIEVNLEIGSVKAIDEPIIGISIQDQQERVVYATNSQELKAIIKSFSKGSKTKVSFTIENFFTNGNYYISCAVADGNVNHILHRLEKATAFAIEGWPMPHSLTHVPCKVKVIYR